MFTIIVLVIPNVCNTTSGLSQPLSLGPNTEVHELEAHKNFIELETLL